MIVGTHRLMEIRGSKVSMLICLTNYWLHCHWFLHWHSWLLLTQVIPTFPVVPPVIPNVPLSSEISPHLLDILGHNFLQTFPGPRHDFADPLTFPLAPPQSWHLWLGWNFLDKFRIGYNDICPPGKFTMEFNSDDPLTCHEAPPSGQI